MCGIENSNFSHKIYKSDPLLFKNYVGKEVSVTTEVGSNISGIVYTVDPVSESVVLLQGREKFNLKIVFGHAIKRIDVVGEEITELPEMFRRAPTKMNASALEDRKNIVKQLLIKNRFPVKEKDNILIIEDIVTINPPYDTDSCLCSNSIILSRVQSILLRAKT